MLVEIQTFRFKLSASSDSKMKTKLFGGPKQCGKQLGRQISVVGTL